MRNITRLLLTLAALAAVLCLVTSCTIRDDNGNPADPGIGTDPGGNDPGGNNPGGNNPSRIPLIRINTDSNYVRVNNSFTVNLTLRADTTQNAAAIPNARIQVLKSDPAEQGPDTLLIAPSLIVIKGDNVGDNYTLTTDAQGRASLTFIPEATGIVELTFRYNTEQATMRIQVTSLSSTPRSNVMISATRTTLRANGSDKSLITLLVKNDNNNPVVGDTVIFSATDLCVGMIPEMAVTGEDGRATVEFTSGRRNGIATVYAHLKRNPTVGDNIKILISGVTVAAAPERPVIRRTGDSTIIVVEVLDADGRPIIGEQVLYPATMTHGTALSGDNVTDNLGRVYIKAVRGATTSAVAADTAIINSADTEGMAIVRFSDNTMTITPAAGSTFLAGATVPTVFNIQYRGSNFANVSIEVSVTLGSSAANGPPLFTQIVTTDASGNATFSMNNPSFTTEATIFAKAAGSNVSGIARVYFQAAHVDSIALVVTPAVISTGIGRARLIATAFDANKNRVEGALIAFNIVSGPGGGERIDTTKAAVTTGADGTAESYLWAGSIPSQFRGVSVRASNFNSVPGDIKLSNTVQLTIAGPPHSITIIRNISELIKGTATYSVQLEALVSDINGNPVADETEVTFSVLPTGYQYYRRVAHFQTVDGMRVWDTTNTYEGVFIRSEHLDLSRRYNPYPPFNDINKNGVPDSGSFVEPCDPMDLSGPDICANGVYADFNKNGRRDFIESFVDPANDLLGMFNTAAFTTPDLQNGFDIDVNRNGIADPATVLLVNRTSYTVDGKAANLLTYGQSDALRVHATVWAEASGLQTEGPRATPLEFLLPIAKDDMEFWSPFE